MDVSRATAAEKQQRPFLPAALAASSSFSPLPGADKGDGGMHNGTYLMKNIFLLPSQALNFVMSLNVPGHQERPEEILQDLRAEGSTQPVQSFEGRLFMRILFLLSRCFVCLDPADHLLFHLQELVDKRRAMMEDYRKYREAAMKMYQEQRSLRLDLRGGAFTVYSRVPQFPLVRIYFCISQAGEERERAMERCKHHL